MRAIVFSGLCMDKSHKRFCPSGDMSGLIEGERSIMPDSHKTLVMKFGGTSVGSVDALAKATQIIKNARVEYPRVVVITSAMSSVTDLLLKCATLAVQGNIDSLPDAESALREKHFAAANALIKDEKV